MSKPPKLELEDDELIEEMEKLEDAVRSSVVPLRKQMLRGFVTGIASGIGALVVAVIVIPLLIYLLSDIQWIPLIGGFADRISEYMQKGN